MITRSLVNIVALVIFISELICGARYWVTIGAMAAGVAAFYAPRQIFCLFLAALPIFGNRPGSDQTFSLLLVSLGLHLGVSASRRRASGRDDSGSEARRIPCLLFLCSFYLLVSLGSLCGLPLKRLLLESWAAVPAVRDLSAISWQLHSILVSTEELLWYSPLSVLWTALSLSLAIMFYHYARASSAWTLRFCQAVLSGLLLSLAAGLLDYYGLIDLRFLRGLDPVVNPGEVQFRLQSFFGHSGWFAEYLTLTIPFVLVCLLLPYTFLSRAAIMLLILLAGEFVLLLTFQRGGWLSYPLTLFVVWSAIYVIRKHELGESDVFKVFKSSLLKILISMPLTVVASLALIVLFKKLSIIPGNTGFDTYVDRFADIAKTSDRTQFMRAGYLLGKIQPLLGNGSESFAYQYRRHFRAPGAIYHGEIELPLHGSAHNVYLQTFSGKGVIGLITLLALLLLTIREGIRTSLSPLAVSMPARVSGAIGASFACAFLIYGNVQEIFYVQPLQFLFFFAIALTASQSAAPFYPDRTVRHAAMLLLATALVMQLWMKPEIASDPAETYGCYGDYETAQRPVWCKPRARIRLPVHIVDGKPRAAFRFRMGESEFPPDGVTFQVYERGKLVAEQAVSANREYELTIDLNAGHANRDVLLDIRTASYFIPARDTKRRSRDMRILSYQLNP
ncbi:MAG: hypothetical protein DCC75_05735 [Proteobacteria bacterium]|nr:MAG: hypothetical protein DCC75_05735 [Pseudomonadota bacterium]